MRRPVALILSLIFIFTPILGIKAAAVDDLPPDHWAFDAVMKLVERGFISLYDDGTFRGDREVNRYQLAEIIARILNYMETADVAITGEDVQDLRRLTLEFRRELVELTEELDFMYERINSLEEYRVIATEDLARYHKTQQELQVEISQLINEIVLVYALQEQIARLETEMEIQSDYFHTSLVEVEYNMEELIQSYQQQIETLNYDLEANQDRFRKLETENRRLKIYMGGLGAGLIGLLLLFLFSE